MTMFIVVALTVVVIALGLLLPVLWQSGKAEVLDRSSQNISIIKEQLAQLEESLTADEITQEQYQQSRDELQAGLLQDASPEEGGLESQSIQTHGRWIAILLGLIVPMFILGGYFILGTPAALTAVQEQASSNSAHAGANPNLPSVEDMLVKLEQKLQQNPQNLDGWMMAGRSYMTLQRYTDAARVLKRAYKLSPKNPAIIFRYADALAMAHGGQLAGLPSQLLEQGLKLEPDNVMGLWLSGNASAEQQKYAEAIRYWQRARQFTNKEPASVQELDRLIANARQQLSGNVEVVVQKQPLRKIEGIRVTVTLAETLANRVKPNDKVFVLAKAMQGPPMPLAVVRKTVSDLPLSITLTENMAMAEGMSLSNFADVVLVARVSKTGQARAAHGDLFGRQTVLDWPHAGEQHLVIQRVWGQR